MEQATFTFTVEATEAGLRVDRFLAGRLAEVSRARIQAWLKEGAVVVNGKAAKPSAAVEAGDVISGAIPEPAPAEAIPQELPLEFLYEDAHLAVLNKTSGMVVHPGDGNPDGTLVNALLHHFGALSSVGGVLRPGIVHRLDKETSGCLVVARDDQTHQALSEQFSGRSVKKTYLAVTQGIPTPREGRIETRIGRNPRDRQKMAVVQPPAGKVAVTDYKVMNTMGSTALVRCDLHTGRTHQIRVHLRYLGTPIFGDATYGRKGTDAARVMLHAWRLAFTHPTSGELLRFEAPIPPEFFPWTQGVAEG